MRHPPTRRSPPPTYAAADTTPVPAVPVTVFNYAKLSPRDLDLALLTTEQVMGEAGVTLVWQRCTPDQGTAPSACDDPLLPGDLALRLLKNGPRRLGAPASAPRLGFAVQDRRGAGVLASVYTSRVNQLARASTVPSGRLIGLIAAHELGHLLLETAGHAADGIMRWGWAAGDLKRQDLADWRFSSTDADALREAARRRGPAPSIAQRGLLKRDSD